MASMKRPRLTAVAALSDYRLRLTFQDGSIYTVSLAEDFDKPVRWIRRKAIRHPRQSAVCCAKLPYSTFTY